MTLILTVANREGIHQSSDYRLSVAAPGGYSRYVDDKAGTKQISSHGFMRYVNVTFTGLARLGPIPTRTAIAQVLDNFSREADPGLLVPPLLEQLNRHIQHRDVRRISNDERRLTVVLAIARAYQVPEIIVLSNSDTRSGQRRPIPTRLLEAFRVRARRKTLLLFGFTKPVSRHHRRWLKHLARTGRDSTSIQRALATINAEVANDRNSKSVISPGCWTSALTRTHQSSGLNNLKVPGLDPFLDGYPISQDERARIARDVIKTDNPTIVQWVGRGGFFVSSNPEGPLGEPLSCSVSVAAHRLNIRDHQSHQHVVTLIIDRLDLLVAVYRDRWTELPVLALALDNSLHHSRLKPASRRWITIESALRVDGCRPRWWRYSAHLSYASGAYTFAFEQTWGVIRRSELEDGHALLGMDDELVLSFPHKLREFTYKDGGRRGESERLTLFAHCRLQKRTSHPTPLPPIPQGFYMSSAR